MIDRTLARRYAEAYVNALEKARLPAGQAGQVEQGLAELKVMAQAFADFRDFQRFLGNPKIAPEEKWGFLKRVFADSVGPLGMGLLELLLKKDRVDHLPFIHEEAILVWEARQGIVRGRVITAHPISAKETEALAQGLSRRLGKRVLLERQLDPKLMGGVRTIVGSSVLDGSAQTLLEELRRSLKMAKVG